MTAVPPRTSVNGSKRMGDTDRHLRANNRSVRRTRTRQLLSLEETALLLGLGRSTLYRAVRRGTVPFPVYRIGGFSYVPRVALERLLRGDEPNGTGESLLSEAN
jgi:excisionase family DNA binding protein